MEALLMLGCHRCIEDAVQVPDGSTAGQITDATVSATFKDGFFHIRSPRELRAFMKADCG
jgi:hypothetical protein